MLARCGNGLVVGPGTWACVVCEMCPSELKRREKGNDAFGTRAHVQHIQCVVLGIWAKAASEDSGA